MRVTLFRAFPDSYRQSMQVYADSLERALRPLLSPTEEVTGFLPRGVRLAPKLVRYGSQYVRYPLEASGAQGDVNHVIDHAYGHLLWTLNPSKTVVTVHDAIALKNRAQPALLQHYNLSGIRKAAAILCDSEASRRDLLALTGYPAHQVKVIYLGVSENFFKEGSGEPRVRFHLPSCHILLHVGHNKFYKNIPALLRVLAILAYSLRLDVKLLKVGDAFTKDQEGLAKTLGVADRIVHQGIVSSEDLPDLYRCADLLLLPSLDEGFGLPVLEAMASGIPVVASNRGALPEIVGEAGLLVDPGDIGAMVKGAAAILQQPELRSKLRELGLRRARQFTWEKTAERTLTVYRKIFNSRWH